MRGRLIRFGETTNAREVECHFRSINDHLRLRGPCLACNNLCDNTYMIPGKDNNPVAFLLWGHRLQMTKFHPLRNWNGSPVIGQDGANFMMGALAIFICKPVG